jgi:hypothetical protein
MLNSPLNPSSQIFLISQHLPKRATNHERLSRVTSTVNMEVTPLLQSHTSSQIFLPLYTIISHLISPKILDSYNIITAFNPGNPKPEMNTTNPEDEYFPISNPKN